MEQSIYQQLRRIGFSLTQPWSTIDLQTLNVPSRKAIDAVRRQIQLSQAVAKDYEMSEAEVDTRAQLRILPKLVKAIEQLRASILQASEFDLVSAVDVAQYSAQLDDVSDRLK